MENFPVLCLFLFLSFSLACAEQENVLTMNINAETPLVVVNGLSARTFYKTTCPKLDSLIHQRIIFDLKEDLIQAADLLCLHFHNCFVQGCDGSVPFPFDASISEKEDASPDLTQTFQIINDVIALAARDPLLERSARTVDQMFKGRRLQHEDHRSKREPPKPSLDRGHDGQHN